MWVLNSLSLTPWVFFIPHFHFILLLASCLTIRLYFLFSHCKGFKSNQAPLSQFQEISTSPWVFFCSCVLLESKFPSEMDWRSWIVTSQTEFGLYNIDAFLLVLVPIIVLQIVMVSCFRPSVISTHPLGAFADKELRKMSKKYFFCCSCKFRLFPIHHDLGNQWNFDDSISHTPRDNTFCFLKSVRHLIQLVILFQLEINFFENQMYKTGLDIWQSQLRVVWQGQWCGNSLENAEK